MQVFFMQNITNSLLLILGWNMSFLDSFCEIHPINGEQWWLMVPYFNFMAFILLNLLFISLQLGTIAVPDLLVCCYNCISFCCTSNNVWKLKSYKLLHCTLHFFFFFTFYSSKCLKTNEQFLPVAFQSVVLMHFWDVN